MAETKIILGGSLEEDAAAFLDAWHRTEQGEKVDENILAFESWEALASVMTAAAAEAEAAASAGESTVVDHVGIQRHCSISRQGSAAQNA